MEIGIGIAGLGTIGTGVAHLLQHNANIISDKAAIDLKLVAVADLDLERERGLDLQGIDQYADAMQLVEDPRIQILVELVGGVKLPLKLIKAAIKAGKHVVTANKALLAEHGREIYGLAADKGLALGIEASVAGGIPVIKSIREALVGNRIQEIRGIINGTCNYILTKMAEEELPFQEALSQAQQLGFAEADPTLDISGGDAAHKIAILASMAFNSIVALSDVHCEGIEGISVDDIQYAAELGYVVKMIAIAREDEEKGIEARVHPMLVPNTDPLAHIRNEFNAVYLRCDYLGDAMLTGKGAGSYPTTSAVVGDLVDIGIKIRDHARIAPFFSSRAAKPMIPFGDTRNRYYLRFTTHDKPGILSAVTGVLGENSISIASVMQKEAEDPTRVPVIMLTHEAREEDLQQSIDRIEQMEEVHKPVVILRSL